MLVLNLFSPLVPFLSYSCALLSFTVVLTWNRLTLHPSSDWHLTGSNVRHAIISVVTHEPEVNSGQHEALTNWSLLNSLNGEKHGLRIKGRSVHRRKQGIMNAKTTLTLLSWDCLLWPCLFKITFSLIVLCPTRYVFGAGWGLKSIAWLKMLRLTADLEVNANASSACFVWLYTYRSMEARMTLTSGIVQCGCPQEHPKKVIFSQLSFKTILFC